MTDERRRWKGPKSEPERGDSGRAVVEQTRARNAKTPSSKRWIERQLNDPYVRQAKARGYRARAAFKLLQLDEKFAILRPGVRVLDLGAAPGGWAQVAAAKRPAALVGIDLLPIEPISGAVFIEGDFLDPGQHAGLLAALGGPPDVVLSDMAANTTGHAPTDKLRTGALAEAAAAFAVDVLAPGGTFVTKAFQGGLDAGLLAELKRVFTDVRHAKPAASRSESHEIFLVARGFRGGGT